jgi:hypothetical protein
VGSVVPWLLGITTNLLHRQRRPERRQLHAFASAIGGVRAFVLDRGLVGLPPVGRRPSAPETGELVIAAYVFSAEVGRTTPSRRSRMLAPTCQERENGSRVAALLRALAGSGRNVQSTAAPVRSLHAATLPGSRASQSWLGNRTMPFDAGRSSEVGSAHRILVVRTPAPPAPLRAQAMSTGRGLRRSSYLAARTTSSAQCPRPDATMRRLGSTRDDRHLAYARARVIETGEGIPPHWRRAIGWPGGGDGQ